MRRCPNGHCFDDDELICCPECGLPMKDYETQTEEQMESIQREESDNQSSDPCATEVDKAPSKALAWWIFGILFAFVAFVILEITDTTFFVPSWHKYTAVMDSQTDSDLRHGITKLNDVDGLRIIDSSNYIFGVLKGQLYDSRFIPENISQLSYFPSGLLRIWDYVNELYFEKDQNGQVITIRTNVGDLLSGDGWFSCLCRLHGQDKQVDAVTIDSTTFQYELPEGAIENFYWWICNTYGGVDENNGNDVTGMIYFNILDGKITEATITFSNQEVSIFFKSVYGQFNEVNYAKSGTELNLKYDFYSGELASTSGF